MSEKKKDDKKRKDEGAGAKKPVTNPGPITRLTQFTYEKPAGLPDRKTK